MDALLPAALMAALILLNGLFVAAEFAIIGAPRPAIDRRAAAGERAARFVARVLHDPRRQDRFIATAQLGITFTSLGLGMYGEYTLATWLGGQLAQMGFVGLGTVLPAHAVATVLAILFLTYWSLVVGEMAPKSIALMHAERTSLAVVGPMRLAGGLMYPLVVALNGIGSGLLRIFGVRREVSASQYYSSDEIQHIVRESQEGGLLQADSGQMLRDLFEFGDLTAGEAMVPRVRVTGLPLGETADALRAHILDDRHTRYPVYEGDLDHIVGVVHIKDLLGLLRDGQPLTAERVRPTAYLPETASLERVLEAMREARTQMIVVMDEHGGTAGIVTIEDLCAEAVGEVEESEGGEVAAEIVRRDADRADVDGTVRLDEVGEVLGRTLEHDEVDTVSGLVLSLLERPPVVGDAVVYEGVRFEVLRVEGHGVERCLVSVEPELPPADEAG